MGNSEETGTYSVEVLGPLTVSAGGAVLDLGGPKQRLLLALLLADIDHVVTTERLIYGMWGDDSPATARKAVQVYVSNLRRHLGDGFPLRTAPGGYLIQSADLDVDAVTFMSELESAKATLRIDPLGSERLLSTAIARWNGPAYADLDGESALESEVARLTELRFQALEIRLDSELRVGHHADVIGELVTLSAEHPYRERFRELHMLALYRSGRQTEALRAFQRTRSILVDELGIEPGPSLQALHQQILEQSSDLDSEVAGAESRYAFMATDIEASTAMWEAEPEAMQKAVARHDEIIAEAVNRNAGTVFKGTGDGIFAVFAEASDALKAAVDAQRLLHAERWPTAQPVLVRIGVDDGPAMSREGDYFGPALNRVSRIMSSGHGGQVLCPEELATQSPVPTRNLGGVDYKGVGRLDVTQLEIPDLPCTFADLQTDRAPKTHAREGFGHAIRGYELRERLGEGAHGVVYRAYQAAIGREAAIKVIRPEHANRSDFVKRFEAEAQFVAQLEHPHIVSLYDYWRDPEGAYLVMQMMRGGSLAASLERAPWRPPAALQLLDQVGSALDYAHRQGVMHRDLKPANVLLDGEGNAFLSDFGIASDHVESVGVPAESSVAYVSPEELAGEPVGLAADMYGLALLTYEILVGDRPALGGQPAPIADLRQDLPPALDQVFARAANPDPTKRFDRVDDFLRALRQVFGADVVVNDRRSSLVEIRNPYKGLRAFAETDAQDFFGRDDLVRELVEHVTTHRLTAIVGPSGSGKSSLVRAGLLPQIRQLSTNGPGSVLITDMFPGSYPFEELEAALLRVAVDRQEGRLTELLSDDRGLLRMTKQLLPDDDSELLLVIDQFEELFLLTHGDEARQKFLDSLVTVISDERSRVRVVITMRADHFDRPLTDPKFGELVRNNLIPIAMPGHDELTRAIAQPAAAAGLGFEAGLIPRIVHDVAGQPGALPLLQYALTELVRTRDDTELTSAGYESAGGVEGALTLRAEEIFEGLSPASREAAREMFLRLVAVDNSGDDTRRRVRRSELESLGLGESALDSVLDAYGSFRLLSFDHDPVTRGPTVEVAHEALISKWPRYRAWVDERREDLLLERRLEAAASEWESNGRERSFLFGGGQLDRYHEWSNSTDLRLTEIERSFLDESRAVSEAETTTRKRRRRGVLSAVALLAVLAMVAAAVALAQRNDANESAARAKASAAEERVARDLAEESASAEREARESAEGAAAAERDAVENAFVHQRIAESARLSDQQPSLSMLIALELYERAPGPETIGAVVTALQRTDGYLGHIELTEAPSNDHWVGALDNETIVVRSPTSIDVYDLVTRRRISQTLSVPTLAGTWSNGAVGGGRFATVGQHGDLRMIEPGENKAGGDVGFGENPGGVRRPDIKALGANSASAVAFNEGGSMIVGYGTGEVDVLVGPDGGNVTTLVGHPYRVVATALSSDAKLAMTQDQWGNFTLWDVDSSKPRWTWTPGAVESWDPNVEPLELTRGADGVNKGTDGTALVAGLVDGGPQRVPGEALPDGFVAIIGKLSFSNDDTTVYFLGATSLFAFDVRSGELKWRIRATGGERQLAEREDGTLIYGNRVIQDGRAVRTLPGIGSSTRVAITPDGKKLISISTDGISIWSTDGNQLLASALERDSATSATLSRNGRELAAYEIGTNDGSIREVGSATSTPAINDEDASWFTAGGALVSRSEQGAISLRDPDTRELFGPPLESQALGALEISPDARLVAVGDKLLNEVRIYEVETGVLIKTIEEPLITAELDFHSALGASGVFWIDFSPDGQLIAVSNVASVAIWETETWTERGTVAAPEADTFTDLAFSPDGLSLALVSERGVVALHDPIQRNTTTLTSGAVASVGILGPNSIEFTADGSWIITAGEGASIIDVETGKLVGTPFPSSHLPGASIAGLGGSFVTGTEDHLLVWSIEPDKWPDIACLAAGRNMTSEEWEQFGWPGESYHETCPQWVDEV